tara:strand:+ start:141065 stop:142144 length:1080 start_codon:yes stop_codon:yes gene_type:complete
MKKRYYLTGLTGLIILIALLAYSQRARIALGVMPRAVENALSHNPIDDLGPGLHIVLCGAGGPLPDPDRSGPCVAIIAGGNIFVVDAGTNGMRNLGRMQYPQGAIETVFLTHFHSDHIDGLGEMATLRWVAGNRKKPLDVVGPTGVSDIVDGFNKAYARDALYRHEHHGDGVAALSGSGMQAIPFTPPAIGDSTMVYDANGLTVQMITVDHAPVAPAVGYLFTYAGRTVLVSGDTKKSDNLERFAQGVDLLVHEALSAELVGIMHQAAEKVGNDVLAKITTDIPDYHATPLEAAQTARDAGVGHLLYYHIVPVLLLPGTEAAWLRGVDEVFDRYTLGSDGTTLSLPAGSSEIVLVQSGL